MGKSTETTAVAGSKLMECPECKSRRPLSTYDVEKQINEEATMTCPVCNTKFAISAAVVSGVPPPERPPGEPGPPASPPPGGPEVGAGEEFPPAPPIAGESVEQGVFGCLGCGNEWVGVKAESCPSCGGEDSEAVDKTVKERVRELFLQVESGADMSEAISSLLPSADSLGEASKPGKWEGNVASFSTKIQAVLADLGMEGLDLGEVISVMEEAKAVAFKKNEVTVDVNKSVESLASYLQDAEPEMGAGGMAPAAGMEEPMPSGPPMGGGLGGERNWAEDVESSFRKHF